ncbi:MAG: zf-HC2 domain-containing protein [Acidobacteriota bacterium]|nr:zf-HC2 domain-containing protein [Acidobacteriota bacterium]
MNAPETMYSCPIDDQMLAAFIDGRLTGEARSEVVAHVAECGACRSIVVDAQEIQAELAAEDNVVRPDFRRKQPWVAVASIAAAAILAVLLIAPLRERLFGGNEMSRLVAATEPMKEYPLHGRLSADFPYKPAKPSYRGPADEVFDSSAYKVMGELARLESGHDDHALGTATLLVGKVDDAVAPLERALQHATAEERPAIANDLAAALLARGRFRSNARDHARALELLDGLWRTEKTAAVAWNRAVALTQLGRDAEAIRAWDEYLKLDAKSPWAQEAVRRRDDLRRGLAPL